LTGVRSLLASPNHDPRALALRAEQAAAAGDDVRVVRSHLSPAALDRLLSSPVPHLVPERDEVDRTVGVRVHGVVPDSGASDVGLEDGDLVLSLNGYLLDRPEIAAIAYDGALRDRQATIELFRRGRRVVLALAWPG
jgi:S1-C subfamily serine protease